MKVYTLIFCLIVLLFAGCTHSELWEKTGGNQESFDLDSRECELIAHQVAMLQSETGRKADPSSFSKTYIECLVHQTNGPKLHSIKGSTDEFSI